MRCERLTKTALVILLTACSRETHAPPPSAPTTTTSTTTTSAPATAAPAEAPKTYADALLWMKSTPGFTFALEEDGVRAVGTVRRERIGTEKVQMIIDDNPWSAEATARGIVWTPPNPPPITGRLYQRVTLAIDPQKKEGDAQLVETVGGAAHYRFTDANSGDVHDVWVNAKHGHIEKMTIGDRVKLTITNAQ